MQKSSTKRILLWITVTTVILVLIILIILVIPQLQLAVTILNPKFHLLSAKLSHGETHELARANWPVTQLSKLLRSAGVNAVVPIQLPPMPENSYALAVRYTGDFAPNELSGMKAELVDASGAVTLLRSQAAYNSQRTRDEYGRIWLLDSAPTNRVTIRLRPGLNLAPLAELRIQGR